MYSFAKYKNHYKEMLRLAFPIIISQLGYILVQFADNVMVGQYGGDDPLPLAAVSFGVMTSLIFFLAGQGLTLGLTPLIGELYKKKNKQHSYITKLIKNYNDEFFTSISITIIKYFKSYYPR